MLFMHPVPGPLAAPGTTLVLDRYCPEGCTGVGAPLGVER